MLQWVLELRGEEIVTTDYEVVWQTHTPVKFEDIPKELMLLITNGCGGKGGWIVPPHALFYYTSCNHHDYGYGCGGNGKNRLECDTAPTLHEEGLQVFTFVDEIKV